MEKDNIKNYLKNYIEYNLNCEYPEVNWFHKVNRIIDTLYFEETYKYLEEKYNK